MNAALTLLVLATQLLTQVSASPHLPESFKENAIQVAEYAISFAKAEIAKAISPTSQTIPIIETDPILGSTPLPEEPIINQTPKQKMLELRNIFESPDKTFTHGHYAFQVSVKDENGNYIKDAVITLNNTQESAPANAQTSKNSKDWYASLSFTPAEAAKKNLTFSFEGQTLTVEINPK